MGRSSGTNASVKSLGACQPRRGCQGHERGLNARSITATAGDAATARGSGSRQDVAARQLVRVSARWLPHGGGADHRDVALDEQDLSAVLTDARL